MPTIALPRLRPRKEQPKLHPVVGIAIPKPRRVHPGRMLFSRSVGHTGAPDGTFLPETWYELPHDLADEFIALGYGEGKPSRYLTRREQALIRLKDFVVRL